MLGELFTEHLNRLHLGANNVFTLANLSDWICKYTYLDGKNYSFEDHEFQKDIIDDPSPNVYCVKAAQTGLTEIWARWVMAASVTQTNFTIIWTFPSSSDADRFTKARLDPMISQSPEISRVLSKKVDSTELKQFGENNFVYVRGTYSDTGALSVPADVLVHDEFDRSDMNNISAYVSRLQHRPTKRRRIFSTPTVAKYGISKLAETSRRKKQMWQCNHCNFHWLPDYENDVIIPGYGGSKKEINKAMLPKIKWREAYLMCPNCKQEPDPSLQHRQWVVENNASNYDDVTYHVAPFCAPKILTPSYLVKVSTEFEKWSEFCNQALGLVAEDSKEMLTEADVRKAFAPFGLTSSEVHYMGVDYGLTCHVTIGRPSEGKLLVVYREAVPLHEIESRKAVLQAQFRCIAAVHDSFPYTDLIARMCGYDPNSWGAIYTNFNSTETHRAKQQEELPEDAKLGFRQVQINRDVAFDSLMEMFKKGNIVIANCDPQEIDKFVAHCTSMKRVQVFDKQGGVRYRWVKTDGEDHYHHSLLYCQMATNLRGTISPEMTDEPPSLIITVKPKRGR